MPVLSPEIRSALLKISPSIAGLIVVMVVVRLRRSSLREDVRLVPPSRKQAAFWLFLQIIWIALTEWLLHVLGVAAPSHSEATGLAAAITITGMVILAPLNEELIFRGLIFRAIEKTKAGSIGAVLVSAAVFAAVHTQYFGAILALVFLDAVIYGVARWQSRSVPLTIAMHALGNALAAWQRFA